ncbi:MAG: hypothetical protein IJ845_08355 [Bacteroidaceae bacterium]|nr:hypothetical protein [Bacteroidaceae bacterium]
MKTTKRKEWGSPIGKVQKFIPNEFVAACLIPARNLPGGQVNLYVDGYSYGMTTQQHTSNQDRYCEGTESVTASFKTAFPGSFKDKGLEYFLEHNKTWHVDQAYNRIDGNASGGISVRYNDISIFKPVVVLHVGSNFYYLGPGELVPGYSPIDYVPASDKNNS